MWGCVWLLGSAWVGIDGRVGGVRAACADDESLDDFSKTSNGTAAVCIEEDGGCGFVLGCADNAAREEMVDQVSFT